MRCGILALVATLSTLNTAAWADQAPPLSTQDTLDATFRSIYAHARQEFKAKTSPVIISMDGKLILVRNGQQEDHGVLSPAWQTLKTVDHVPLAAFVSLQSRTGSTLDDATHAQLKTLLEQVAAARPDIVAANLAPETAARQQRILDDSVDFINRTLQSGSVSRAQLNDFASAMARPTLANADDAEVMEMNEVDSLVRGWKLAMSPQEWKNLRVIVCDGHMPRDQEREVLYFSELLGEKREGKRLVFSENGDDVQKALDLLATHRLDEQIGISFFHDPWRMHRDFLSDGAKHWLAKHSPPR